MSYQYWLIAGAALIVGEIFVSGYVLLWLGLGAILTGIVAFALPLQEGWAQGITFTTISLVILLLWLRFRKHLERPTDHTNLNQRGRALVGRQVTLETGIENGTGSARLGDGVWSARGPDTPAGTAMIVTEVDGAVLIVQPLEKTDTDTGQA